MANLQAKIRRNQFQTALGHMTPYFNQNSMEITIGIVWQQTGHKLDTKLAIIFSKIVKIGQKQNLL